MMNTLSWLIYGAEIAERVSVTAIMSAIAIGVIASFFLFVMAEDYVSRATMIGNSLFPVLAFMVCVSLAVFVPSKATIYMIAASEAGEIVVTSPEAKEMMMDIQKLLRKQVKEALGEMEDHVKEIK